MAKAFCNGSTVQEYPVYRWNLQSVLHVQRKKGNENYSFMILNTPITNPEIVIPLWENSNKRFVVDGGGNHLYEVITKRKINEINDLLPHFVIGDFDSISSSVLQFYKQRSVKIIHTPDQNKTDFHKALEIVAASSVNNNVMVYCDNVGRFDHIMGNINTLYLASYDAHLKHLNIYLLGNDSLTMLLKPGHHVIQIPETIWSEKSYCSLIPIGEPCKHVTTTGLKWNLIDDILHFGGMVSSSNTYDVKCSESVVTIKTDTSLVWSMTTNEDFKKNL